MGAFFALTSLLAAQSDSEKLSSRLSDTPTTTHQKHSQYQEWERLSQKGDSEALFCLARYHLQSKEANRAEGINFLKSAANQGHTEALFLLSQCYAQGIGVTVSDRIAAECAKFAAERGHNEAKIRYATYLKYGVHADTQTQLPELKKDIQQAATLLASVWGNQRKNALRELAVLYLNDLAFEEYKDSGIQILGALILDSDPIACHYLGNYWMHQNDTSCQKYAFQCYARGFALSDVDCTAKLAYCYEKGIGTQLRMDMALALYNKAVEAKSTFAMTSLADYLLRTHPEDDPKIDLALSMLVMAAAQGDPAAHFMLGVCAYNGIGQKKDLGVALNFFKHAAESNYAPAAYNIAMMYLEGNGVSQNDKEGVRWLEKAANLNHTDAMVKLAACLINGVGGMMDIDYAMHLLRKAARMGNTDAEILIEKILKMR